MLKIKPTHHFTMPDLGLRSQSMQLSAIPDDGDELTQAIVNDVADRDNNWELSERPDMGELTQFWTDVETDVQNDPEWFTFNDE